jgi:hypothetical protein
MVADAGAVAIVPAQTALAAKASAHLVSKAL